MRKFKHFISLAAVLAFSGTMAFGQLQRPADKPANQAVDQCKSLVTSAVVNTNQIINSPDFSTQGTKALLYDNGPFRTDIGTGPGGGDVSMLAAPLTNYGFGHNIAGFMHVADDFLVNATSWTVDSMVFYSYQTGSTLTSTFTAVHVAIWNGDPSLPGSTIVWGDTTTNVLSRSVFSGCYRANTLTGATRPIMRNVVNMPGVLLNGGTYWVQWASAGSLASGPWANPITIVGQAITGNAKQKIAAGAWANLLDGTNGVGLPFEIHGTAVAATCPFPSALTATNISDVSASLGWTEAGTATTWNIEWGAVGFTQGTGTTVTGTTTNPYALAGLTANTSYDFYVQADCGGSTSLWAGPFSFTTLACPIANQCNYVFDYVDSYGDGWNGASVTVSQNGVSMGDFTLAAGGAGTENISICDGAAITLTFNSGAWDSECGLTVTDPFGTVLNTFAPGAAPAGGTTFLTFTSSCTPPACPWPTVLTASSIGLTSAVLGWTNGGTETAWNIEWGAAGFAQGTGTVVPVTSNPYTLSGLTAGTAYEFYVQADCGAGSTSQWTGPFAFSTLCNPVTTFPYTEGFETALMPPACWSSNDADGDTYNWEIRDGSGGWRIFAGAQVAVSASWISGVGALTPDNYLISPQFVINAANLECTFWVAAQDMAYAGEHYSVMVSTTNTAPASFTEVFNETLSDTLYHQVTVPLAAYNGQSIYIAIRHYNVTDMFYMSLDEFAVDFSAGMKENIESTISVYPNPVYNTLFISNTQKPSVSIYNSVGEMVFSSNKKAIDVSGLAEGLYIVKVTDNNNTITKQINILK